LLNKAYETLKDPLKRAEYLLVQRGHPINEEDTLHAQQELLMNVLEVREGLEEAEGDERHRLILQNEGPSSLFSFFFSIVNMGTDARTRGTERIKEAEADIESAVGGEYWDEAKQATIRLRYWYSVAHAAKYGGSNH
jgi:molecular chaperone HscB